MDYVRRAIDDVLDEVLPELPAILLDGPKAVGKTTTAMQRAKTTKRLSLPSDVERAKLYPDWLVAGEKPILIDEWQKLPGAWDLIRWNVDQDYSGGQFLLTGSLPDLGTHSGAGRITSLRMRPLGLSERRIEHPTVSFGALLAGAGRVSGETDFSPQQYAEEIASSGFFNIRTLAKNARSAALDGYIERIIDSDLKEVGLNIRQPETLKAWLVAYAAATATNASWETIRDAANPGRDKTPTRATVLPYRDALTRLRILDELPPWIPSRNQFTRAGLASKHYLADPALAIQLLGLNGEQLAGERGFEGSNTAKPLFGRMFEALAVLTVRNLAQAGFANVMHFRDARGSREIDMIVQRQDGKILAIEVKLSTSPSATDFKHLNWLENQIGDELIGKVVLYAGKEAFTTQRVHFIPLALLGS